MTATFNTFYVDRTELKTCPFCGGFAECFAKDPTQNNTTWYSVDCCNCEATSGSYKHPKIAKEKWNNRISENPKDETEPKLP